MIADRWYFAVGEERRGPVEADELLRMIRDGKLTCGTLVWARSMADWAPAGTVSDLADAPWPAAVRDETTPPMPKRPAEPRASAGDILHGFSRKLSALADLPTISRMSVRQILMGGLTKATRPEDMEETFAVGSRKTTPPLSAISDGWPTPRVFWRVLGAAIATYVLLRMGVTAFHNPNFIPGMIVIGSFVVPLSVVILFFELNTPRNVSVYPVGKLLLLGGTLSLILTSVVGRMLWIVLSVVGWYFVLGILTQALDEVAVEKRKVVAA